MPLTEFICPDGSRRPIDTCAQCPRPEGRCLSLPTLRDAAQDRIWSGKPSTTQLLNPTRMEYLKITKPYAISPESRAFAMLGTKHHQRLEIMAKQIEGIIAEKKLSGTVTGILDLLEPDELNEGFYKLIDYKTWGAYALVKHLGTEGNGSHDRHNLELQLNNYRLMVEAVGFPVSRMMVQCTVRDGGTASAHKQGIHERMYWIPVEFLDNDDIIDYFMTKADALVEAVQSDTMPELCPYEDRWNGRRCKGFCDVAEWCPEGAQVNKMELRRV